MSEIIIALLNSPYATLWMILASVITIALAGLAVVAIIFLRKWLKKMNVDIDENIINSAKKLIKEIVVYFNQKIVDDLKEKSEDGKLTPEQKVEIYNQVLAQVKSVLSNEMIQAILKEYGVTDIDVALEILIEATVAESKLAAIPLPTK